MHVLVVEDDVWLARQISAALTEAGHDAMFVHDGERALDRAKETPFDLIVLDVILPGINGFKVLWHLRSQKLANRVLMLTARNQVQDRVAGLQLGADDYLPKPFVMRELIARANALGRRYSEKPRLRLCVGDLTVDVVNHLVKRGGHRVELTARELAVLKMLMREPGRVFTRTELCERIWEHAHEFESKLIEVFIMRLKRKLGDPALIHTVHYVGYTIHA